MCLSNDGIETTTHFLLLCLEYAAQRTVLLGRISPICASYGVDCSMLNDQELLNLLLHGNDAFNEKSNKSILLATISYINSTNRFIYIAAFYVNFFLSRYGFTPIGIKCMVIVAYAYFFSIHSSVSGASRG